MNDDERARQTAIAVRLLEEAVYDALQSAHANGEEALQPAQIRNSIGLRQPHPRYGATYDAHSQEVVRFALKRMEEKGKVRNLNSDRTLLGRWQLTHPPGTEPQK